MTSTSPDNLEVQVRDALTAWRKLDAIDVKILEGLTLLGPRNLSRVANHTKLPSTTVRYRVARMLSDSILFLHLNPYYTNMGLKRALVFAEAAPGYEENLLDFLKVNDYWVFLCRIYGTYEGCGGIWTIPHDKEEEFRLFIRSLKEAGIVREAEVIWSTCFHNVSVSSRWFNSEEGGWVFKWDEWMAEIETIEGKLPHTLTEPEEWPNKADYTDMLIIKELEIDGKASLPDISKRLELPLSTVKYHFHKHVTKLGLIGGYQVEIYRFPFPLCEILFFKFEFDDYEKMAKFAISLLDKPFVINIGKVLDENALVIHAFLPKWEFRRLISALSTLIKRGLLKRYHYVIQDMYQTWRETIPFEHFKDGEWSYSYKEHLEKIKILEKEAERESL